MLDYAQIGHKVRLAREGAGLSQEEVGRRLGCSGVTVSSWETGKRRISLEDLYAVAKVLGKPLAYFFPEGSLSLNVEDQIGALLQRSIGDFLGTRQIPVYTVARPGDPPAPSPVTLSRHMSVAAHLGVDFGVVVPDNRLATVGISAGDIALCRRCGDGPPREDCLVLSLEGSSLTLRMVAAGGEAARPAAGGAMPGHPQAGGETLCGILVCTIKHAEDILAALKAIVEPPNRERRPEHQG